MRKKPKLCLACSAGGHLQEMLQLKPVYSRFEHFFFTFKRADSESLSKKEKVYFAERPARNPFSTLQTFAQAWKVLEREKPDAIISTGADVAVPMLIAGKLKGARIVFIESFCRPSKPSVSGRIAYLLSDL